MTQTTHTPSDLLGRERFVPGYGVMMQMCGQLIAEKIGEQGLILIVGAGGGLEIEALSRRAPNWRFCAVDPDPVMLQTARDVARACGAEDRTQWVEDYVYAAPQQACNAATCLLTMHFVADNGEKLKTLQAIRARLKPGAPLVLVDLCIDKAAPDYEMRLSRYCGFALDSGAAPDLVDQVSARLRNVLQTVPEQRVANLIAEAGFQDADLFYAGHSWRGWVATA